MTKTVTTTPDLSNVFANRVCYHPVEASFPASGGFWLWHARCSCIGKVLRTPAVPWFSHHVHEHITSPKVIDPNSKQSLTLVHGSRYLLLGVIFFLPPNGWMVARCWTSQSSEDCLGWSPNKPWIFPSCQAGKAGNVTAAPDAMVPSQIFCSDNTQISPGRVKMSLYGYTWGKNWESDVAGQDFVFFRWRLCFESRSWYINQVLNGEGGPSL